MMWMIQNIRSFISFIRYNFYSKNSFNPQKYCSNIDTKLQTYKTTRRCKFVENRHIVFVTRGRTKVLFKEVRILINQFLREQDQEREFGK